MSLSFTGHDVAVWRAVIGLTSPHKCKCLAARSPLPLERYLIFSALGPACQHITSTRRDSALRHPLQTTQYYWGEYSSAPRSKPRSRFIHRHHSPLARWPALSSCPLHYLPHTTLAPFCAEHLVTTRPPWRTTHKRLTSRRT